MVVPTPERGAASGSKAPTNCLARQSALARALVEWGLPSFYLVFVRSLPRKKAMAVGRSSAERVRRAVEGTAAPCHAFRPAMCCADSGMASPLTLAEIVGGDEPWGRHGVSSQESALATRIRGRSDIE